MQELKKVFYICYAKVSPNSIYLLRPNISKNSNKCKTLLIVFTLDILYYYYVIQPLTI